MKKNNDKNDSISATILSFMTTLLGFSSFEINKVWEFILGFVILIIIYLIWYFIVKYFRILISLKFSKPNEIIFEPHTEIERLKNNTLTIYWKFLEYKKTSINEYKKILYFELEQKIFQTEKLIELINKNIKKNKKFFLINLKFNSNDLRLYINFIKIIKKTISEENK